MDLVQDDDEEPGSSTRTHSGQKLVGKVIGYSDTHQIASIMAKDAELVKDRDLFSRSLGLTDADVVDLERKVKAEVSMSSYSWFTTSLSIWILRSLTPQTTTDLINNLLANDFSQAAAKICNHFGELLPNHRSTNAAALQSGPKSLRIFGVPDPVYKFTGRGEELDEIHESILKQNASLDSDVDLTVITAIKGMAGIGKTSLTIQYAWKYYNNSFYHTVLWIDSETSETLTESLQELAQELGTTTTATSALQPPKIASEIYKLISTQPSLVIFDNVETPEQLKNFLPAKRYVVAVRPNILVTSRFQKWGCCRANGINLDVLGKEDSAKFVVNFLELQANETEYSEGLKVAKEISSQLQYLPLALVQAAAFIKVQAENKGRSCSGIIEEMHNYPKLFRKNCDKLLSFEHWTETNDIYEKTVFTTWQITIDKLKSKNWLTEVILETIAYFAPDDIPIELLSKIPMMDPDQQKSFLYVEVGLDLVEDAVKLLTSYSMVTREGGADSISVHRLLQAVVRKGVEDRLGHSVLRRAMKIIRRCSTVVRNLDDEDVYLQDVCLSHAISVKNFRPSHEDSHKSLCLYDSFEAFVARGRYNSSGSCIRALGQLVDKSKYSEATKAFETFKNKYFGEPIFGREKFVVNFICILLGKIEKLWREGHSFDEVLKLWKYVLDSNPVKYTRISYRVERLVEFAVSTSEECQKNNLLEVVFLVHNINFECAKAIIAENKNSGLFETRYVLESIAKCLLKLKDFPRLFELFENTNTFFINLDNESKCFKSSLQFDIGEFLLKNLLDCDDLTKKPVLDDLMDKCIALITTCPEEGTEQLKMRLIRTIINCLPETDCTVKRGQALDEIRKFQRSFRSSQDSYMNFQSEIIRMADSLRDFRPSNDIRGDINMNEFALFLYKEIYQRAMQNRDLKSMTSSKYHLVHSIIGILHCLDQLGSWEGMVSTITDFKFWLATLESNLHLYHFYKVPKFIYELSNHQSCTLRQKEFITEANNIFRKLRLAAERAKEDWLYANITEEYISLLISVGNFEEVFEILCDYKAWLSESDKKTYGHYCVLVPSTVMEMKHSFSDHNVRSKCLEVVNTIYTEIYMRRGPYFGYELSDHGRRIDCLLELGKGQEIVPFLEQLHNFKVKPTWFEIVDLAFETGLNPNCSGIKSELLQFALKICERRGIAPSIWPNEVRELLLVIDVLLELGESEKLLGYLDKLALLMHPNHLQDQRASCFSKRFEKSETLPIEYFEEFTNCLLMNANHKNISSLVRTELYGLLLKFTSACFRHVCGRTVFWNYNYHYPKISQSALTMIKCFKALDRPAEIVELIQKLTTIFKSYTDNLANVPANFVWFSEIYEYLVELCTEPRDHELIEESVAHRLIKYEFEKKIFCFVDMLKTAEGVVANLVQLSRVDEILKIARNVQQVVSKNCDEIALLGTLSKILDEAIQNLQNCGTELADLLNESTVIKQKIATLQHITSANIV